MAVPAQRGGARLRINTWFSIVMHITSALYVQTAELRR